MRIRNYVRGLAIMLSTAVLLVSSVVAMADDEISATVTMKETQVGFMIGGDWGHGTLTYDGEPHLFHMYGAKLGGAGVTVSDVTGDVYHMQSLEDFPGIYFKAEAGATGGIGGAGIWVKNDKGVSIHLKAKSKGLALSVGVAGLKIGF
jgi:hypothetical protein